MRSWLRLSFIAAAGWAAGLLATPAAAEPRLALVIGNAAYRSAPLLNPVNDARAMAQALQAAGFTVIRRDNAGREDMVTALREFGDQLKGGGVGLFYYAGHGMQVKGRNFLIPVDAKIEREDEVAYAGIDAAQVLDKMETAKNRLNIVILDACRNNPFARSFRSGGSGLAQMDAPVGTLIAFSTAPGSVASDGAGENGLYTQHLLESLRAPGRRIEDVFKQVRSRVRKDTQGQQIPWESTSLEGDFVFVAQPPRAAASQKAGTDAAKPLGTVAAPRLNVGDRWSVQRIDLFSGSIITQFERRIEKVTADEWHTTNSVYDHAWNLRQSLRDGKVVQRWQPHRPNYRFPLVVGGSWTDTGVSTTAQREATHTVAFKVVRQERVLVPAGIFDTLRVEGSGKYHTVQKDGKAGDGTVTHRYWYSPQVGAVVAYEYEETNWKGVLHRKERDELLAWSRQR